MIDPYPGKNSYASYTGDRVADIVSKIERPVTMCLQGFRFDGGKPTAVEMHSMSYQSYLAGARHTGWYGFYGAGSNNLETDPDLYPALNGFYKSGEWEILFKQYSSGKNPTIESVRENHVWYDVFEQDGVTYAALQNRTFGDVTVGFACITGFEAITWSDDVVVNAEIVDGALNVTLSPAQAVLLKVETVPVSDELAIVSEPVNYVGKIGDLAEFTVVATGEGLSYQWYYLDKAADAWLKSSGTEATLTVEFKAHRNNQAYYCVITDAEGNQIATKSVKLIAEEIELAFTEQPADYVGIVGDTVEFSAPATGNGLLYQWYYSTDNGASWSKSYTEGYDTATLQPVLRAYRNGYQYRCEVTDVFGNTITSDAAAMTVHYSEVTVTAQPETVENGVVKKLYYFSVEAEGDNLSYQWQVSMDGGETWENSYNDGCDTARLSVRLYAYRDGYQYRCIVTSGVTNAVTSDAATLNLQDASVAIVKQPTSRGVLAKNTVTFQVEATGLDLTYQWYRSNDGGNTWVKTYLDGYDTDTLSFVANANRCAWYKCLIIDGSGTELMSSPAKLFLIEKELVLVSQPEDVVCERRDTVTLTVEADGVNPKYQWFASEDGENWVETYLDGYDTNELSFVATTARAAKLYKCVITDAGNNTVETEPISITMN